MKRITVKIAGTDEMPELEIGPETRARDILAAVHDQLSAATEPDYGWHVAVKAGAQPFDDDEPVYAKVADGGRVVVSAYWHAD